MVVAVSGGADSMALWDLLVQDGRWPLIVWHLDHGLRAEAWRDAEAIRTFAVRHPPAALVCERADVVALAQADRCSCETAGRRERYRRLLAVAAAHGATAVVTAHHQDDQAETVLMHLLRGAGPRGAAGIPPVRTLGRDAAGRLVRLVRPLLGIPRASLRAHVQAQGIPWHEDVTNADPTFTRNRIRHRVLPVFEQGVPGFASALVARAVTQRAQVEALEARIEDWWSAARREDALHLAGLPTLDAAERLALWRRLLDHLGVLVDRRRLRRLDDLVLGGCGRRFRCGGWWIERRAEALAWSRGEVSPSAVPDVTIHAPGRHGRLELGEIATPAVVRLPVDQALLAGCRFPLVLRPLRPGERWRALGSPGSRTISRWLMDRGVPSRQRRRLLILADADGVVWIPGHTIAERCRVVPGQGRVLHAAWKNPADS